MLSGRWVVPAFCFILSFSAGCTGRTPPPVSVPEDREPEEIFTADFEDAAPEIMPEPEPQVPGLPRFGAEQMEKVALVTVDPQGFVYAGEPETGRLLRFNSSGELAGQFSIAESPWTGLAVDRSGTIYVAAGERLFRYEGTSGKPLGEVAHPDGAGFFHVAPRPDSGVIASWRNPKRDDLVLVSKEGTIEKIHRSAVTGAIGEPAGDVLVAMDGERRIFAAVNRLHVVCQFKFTGEYLNRFGSEGEEPGQFAGLMAGVAADGQGNVFVSDALGVNVFLSKDGRFLRRMALQGAGLAVSDGDELFAAKGTEIVKAPPQASADG
jgi:hypothetical protein